MAILDPTFDNVQATFDDFLEGVTFDDVGVGLGPGAFGAIGGRPPAIGSEGSPYGTGQ